jgi:membrane protein DedA with SNARE-associated domain
MQFGHVIRDLEPWIQHYGAAAIFLTLTLESFGAPLPGESLLVVAAILAGRGEMTFHALFLSAWAGAVIGDNIGYVIGRLFGRKLLRRYGKIAGLTLDRLQQVEAIFSRYGPATVGFARFFAVLRQLNGVIAGTLAMDWWQFLAFNALGGALWVAMWTGAGFYLGTHETDVAAFVHKLGFLGAIAVLILLVIILVYVFLRPKGGK